MTDLKNLQLIINDQFKMKTKRLRQTGALHCLLKENNKPLPTKIIQQHCAVSRGPGLSHLGILV